MALKSTLPPLYYSYYILIIIQQVPPRPCLDLIAEIVI